MCFAISPWSGLAEVIKPVCVHLLMVVGPTDNARFIIDLADALAFWNPLLPEIGPCFRKAQHQLKILSSSEAPICPWRSLRPAFCQRKPVVP